MLYDLHLSAENYIEAGFALFLHGVRLTVGRSYLFTGRHIQTICCMAVDLHV